jgi:hypothetical protein
MSTTTLDHRSDASARSAAALGWAARSWFLVAVAGQWIFVFYIAVVYGTSAAHGGFSSWNRFLPHGYVSGHTIGNAAIELHLLFAALISFSGALQLVPRIRARAPAFHRWNGRAYLLVAFTMGFTGLYLSLSGRKVVGDFSQHAATVLNGVLILVFAALAWRTAVRREFKTHRRWALRLFLVSSGVWFFRVGLMFWLLVNGGPVGFDMDTFTGPFLTFLNFAQWLLPLVVLEAYLRARDGRSVLSSAATATCLFALTAIMATGVFAATRGMWGPRILRVMEPQRASTGPGR